LRVLLVEDNEINRIVAQNMLESLGCQVISVAGGYAAIDVAASDSFDIILMDRQMPDIDGLETTRRIRDAERGSGKRRTPIVAVTANVTTGDREHYLAGGLSGEALFAGAVAPYASCQYGPCRRRRRQIKRLRAPAQRHRLNSLLYCGTAAVTAQSRLQSTLNKR
jgi:CheY-like chemotaxis protein